MVKTKKPKFKIGDKAYSYQNPRTPGVVNRIRISNDPKYDHAYRLTLKTKTETKNSNWINEKSLRKTKISKERRYK